MKSRREAAKNAKTGRKKLHTSAGKTSNAQTPSVMPPLEEMFLVTVAGLTIPCWRTPDGELADVIYEDTDKYLSVIQKLRDMGRPEYRSWKDAGDC